MQVHQVKKLGRVGSARLTSHGEKEMISTFSSMTDRLLQVHFYKPFEGVTEPV